MAEPWEDCALLEANLRANDAEARLEEMKQELRDANEHRRRAEQQLKNVPVQPEGQPRNGSREPSADLNKVITELSNRLKDSEAQNAKQREEVSSLKQVAKRHHLVGQQTATTESDLKDELARTKAQLLRTEARLQMADASTSSGVDPSRAAATQAHASAEPSGQAAISQAVQNAHRESARLSTLLAEMSERTKVARAHADMQEERAQSAELRNVDLALEIARVAQLAVQSERRAERAEAESQEMRSQIRQLQERCANLQSMGKQRAMVPQLYVARPSSPPAHSTYPAPDPQERSGRSC